MIRFHPSQALVAVVLALTACNPLAPPPVAQADAPVVLRSYAVGSQGGQAVSVLSSAFVGDAIQARVVEGPSGEVIVVAPEDIQTGVKQFLDNMGDAPSGAPPNVELHYTVLSGSPGEGSRPRIAALMPAMDAIEARAGKTDFTVVDTAALVSRSGDWAESSGAEGLSVDQHATVHPSDKSIVAQVKIRVPGHSKIETRIALKDGQVAVLGEVGTAASGTHYYVVSGSVR